MRISFVRHATFVFESGGRRVMVDPMLDAAGATEARLVTAGRVPGLRLIWR